MTVTIRWFEDIYLIAVYGRLNEEDKYRGAVDYVITFAPAQLKQNWI